MNFVESVKYLYSLGHEVLAAKYRLESVTALLDRLGHPDRSFKSVLVAGTNGKGSVCAMLDSIVRTAGHRCGLFTSPHLVRIQERIKVNEQEISETDFAKIATAVRTASEVLLSEGLLDAAPTFFEQVTAITLCYFAQCKVDLAVLEVGIGGRLDATNAVERLASVVTSIDFDHQQLLGNTIEEIAGEKAAIIVPGSRAVIGRQHHPQASEVLMRRCLETQVLPVFANEPAMITADQFGRMRFDYESSSTTYKGIKLGLAGRHQADNAAAAIEAAEVLNECGIRISRESIIEGLRDVQWPGRLELVDHHPAVLLDGAHNAAGARSLRTYLSEFWDVPITLLFGSMGDKDIDRMARELFGCARTIIVTRVNDRRAADQARIGSIALESTRNVIFTETVRQALSWARGITPKEGLICVAGSLHLVGAVKSLLDEADSQTAVM